ncbi:(NiFe) hydrogenase maturation protein HypF [Desulfocapsa sulfexigens DSM 10523]|uniref:Carbamoyltransferase n=1 Tax=Desulfocapsa sulfexigens (strain DSM 10523 / SB164P1) TaxID=1167006 RepID=M1P7Q0_DESSD|nr:carbamoyltransferase HypF [Desulfocapsa sulfexigens]AGF77727.1 (NiFe) hydrogenase maturation protein HypF [Desulfocapsa sulfexigens DSM 10523]
MPEPVLRMEIIALGTVQGVGFRPFVYRLARKWNVTGTILNTDQGVVIEVEGKEPSVQSFINTLSMSPPPLARITSLHQHQHHSLKGFKEFSILKSMSLHKSQALIPADVALCKDCLDDILDPHNRRFSYPFTNCTNCGPRFTIVETIPYDRLGTSMKSFPLCSQCRMEYEDPGNRRFHAQPNACAECGPQLSYHDADGKKLKAFSPLEEVARSLKQGQIVAMRGLGGFHLVVDAGSEEAVTRLRKRKGRKSKPLAVMTASVDEVNRFCILDNTAAELLQGVERPIVLLPRKESCLAEAVTPGIAEIGVMLPYTPLHQLLFLQPDCPRTLVMTSGNRSGAPIFTANKAAVEGLCGIADCFLLHNREIMTRVDDSVARISRRGVQLLRRARGYVPAATVLQQEFPSILACGGGLKSTFCLTRGSEAFLSQHIGDLFNLESLDFYRESIYHFKRLLQVEPEAVVCDLHPDYLSSHYAKELNLPLYKIQHHHAHAAAVLAEHGIEEKVLALVLDGTGLGDDNSSWGGEVLLADCLDYERVGSLTPMLLPGGDAAAEEPWRMGLSLLFNLGQNEPEIQFAEKQKQRALWQMMEQGFNCPVTTSCGRFFDGIAALLGVCLLADYEGQAAMELESLAWREKGGQDLGGLLENCSWKEATVCSDNRLILQQDILVQKVLNQLTDGRAAATIALDFHLCLIRSFFDLLCKLAEKTGVSHIVLTGGCMQNTLLLEGLFILLEQNNFIVHTGQQIPVNDGGIALGQAIIGGLRHVSGCTHESNRNPG